MSGGLRDVRCRVCGRLLFKADGLARIEIVCPDRRCRRMQTFSVGQAVVSRVSGATGR